MKALVFYGLFLFSIQIAVSQNLNTVIKDPDLNKDVMVGKCDRNGLKQGEYGLYFKSQYEVYEPSEKYIEKMKKVKINLVDITIVFGTWCSDSKIQVPRFYKVLDKAGYNEKRMTVIGVSRKKLAFVTNIEHLDIVLVPTFIISQNGKELGRIIETPKKSLEKDLAKIINKARL